MSISFLRDLRPAPRSRIRKPRWQPVLEPMESRMVLSHITLAHAAGGHAMVHVAKGHRAHGPTTTLTNPITDPLSSQGNLSFTNFAVQNGKIVGTGNIVLPVKDAQGSMTNVNAPFTATLTMPTSSSTTAAVPAVPILNLDIQPIHLDVLGLVVQTNEIQLKISAQPGPDNLLGNLLGGVANLLDGTPAGLTNAVNALNNGIPATSTTAAIPGLVGQNLPLNPTGTLSFQSYNNHGGQLVGNGTFTPTSGTASPLTATLTPAHGKKSCPILNLDIQPIHLDLLGLVVDTSEIKVNITAQMGSGQLLGNLLCGITQILDRSTPALGKVGSLLSQLYSSI